MIKTLFSKNNLLHSLLGQKADILCADFTPSYSIQEPRRLSQPFIFNSPHSGRVYPQKFLQASRLDAMALRKSEDAYVEELFSNVTLGGAPLLHAHFPRAYLDVNREPYELDPALFYDPLPEYANTRSVRVVGGLGTIARVVAETEEIYREPLSVKTALERINTLYMPYHRALCALLERTHRKFGYAILIDCHSMPSLPATYASDVRPDFVLGDRYGTSCDMRLTHFIEKQLTDLGYVVVINKPYAGGYITENYGRPQNNIHTLQIEVNRSLYMNEATFEKTKNFGRIRQVLTKLAKSLFTQYRYSPMLQAAAE